MAYTTLADDENDANDSLLMMSSGKFGGLDIDKIKKS